MITIFAHRKSPPSFKVLYELSEQIGLFRIQRILERIYKHPPLLYSFILSRRSISPSVHTSKIHSSCFVISASNSPFSRSLLWRTGFELMRLYRSLNIDLARGLELAELGFGSWRIKNMEDYFPMRLKRKDLEDVSEDFSDFSLSSPARKIRRLDAELPPIIEEEECEIPIQTEGSLPHEQSSVCNYTGGIRIEELPNEPSNEERAIVLFKPMNINPLVQSPSNFSVSPNLISGFKNQVLSSSRSNSWKPTNYEEVENDGSYPGSGCLTVVPWFPPLHTPALGAEESVPQVGNSKMMDAPEEIMEEETMDIEGSPSLNQENINSSDGAGLGQEFHQWQQQHCLIPQPPQNSTTPIFWYH